MSTQGFQQVQKQSQQLILAPQLRQSLKILQVPALELRNVILEELQSNPTLEEMPMDGESFEERLEGSTKESENGAESSDEGSDESPTAERDRERERKKEREKDKTSENGDGELDFKEDFEVFNRMNEDFREAMAEENGNYSYTDEDAERRQHFFDSVTSESSLQEDLLEQARMSDASDEILLALEFLIGSLNDHGFLASSLSDVSLMSGQPLDVVQQAHRLLKTLDPAGIGAENLQECLLLQLEAKGRKNSYAWQVVRNHFELLLRRRIPEIGRRLGVDMHEVQQALAEISNLDPAPGRKFSDDTNRIVVPDVKVEKDEYDEWQIILNNDYIPRLRVSNIYKELIAQGKCGKKEKEYLQDKFRASKFLISSIEQRQQTIERITRELLDFQGEFFEHGSAKLRPLTMSQVAERVGVHETTVSRAIANKYIDTPHGVYDFKYFFTTGYQGQDGNSVSNTSVKERIQAIIDSEDSKKPYSDQQVVNILKDEGIKIARRTVAKYREELGILPTNLRRAYD